MSPLWELLEGARVYDLAQPLEAKMPVSPNHPGFKLALMRRHGDMVRADGGSASNEMMVLGGHTGTHIDALCHVSHDGCLHGGIDASDAQTGGRFKNHGVEEIPLTFCRGVLLDIAGLAGVDVLEPGAPITAADLEAAERRQGVEVRAGDAVLVRSGWPRHWSDAQTFLGAKDGAPGPDESAAHWLAERGVRLTGAETVAYEHIPPGRGHALLPVHRILLVEAGDSHHRDVGPHRLGGGRGLGVSLRAHPFEGGRRHGSPGTPGRRRDGGRMISDRVTEVSVLTLLEHLARFAAGVTSGSLPEEVNTSVRHRVLDIAGLALAARPLATSEMAHRLAKSWGGPQHAGLIGFPEHLPAPAAAFVNGTLAHSLDFDDTHLPSVLHPSASVIPAMLAAGEEVGASTSDAIAAAAAGYEIVIRTGMAGYDRELGNSVFFERGWHATSICGTLAAAAVAAKLYGLDAAGIGHAMAIATSMGSGVIEGNRAGGSVKRLHCGWAAHAGLVAAGCAREGFTGPPSALEGRFGFYRAFIDGDPVAEEITRGLGERWSIPDVFYKPYPANHFTHAGIDAAMKLRPRLDLGQIERIELGVSSPTLRTIAPAPRAEDPAPIGLSRRLQRALHRRGRTARRRRPRPSGSTTSVTRTPATRGTSSSPPRSSVSPTRNATRSSPISSRRSSGFTWPTERRWRSASRPTAEVRATPCRKRSSKPSSWPTRAAGWRPSAPAA